MIRLYVKETLQEGARFFTSSDQAHYLLNVMRCEPGSQIAVFNGRDGEWKARLVSAKRNQVELVVAEQTRIQTKGLSLRLLFSPLKKDATDFLARKGTEMGVSTFEPVYTAHTQSRRIRTDRFLANVIEAVEQSERLTVPEVLPPVELESLFKTWVQSRVLYFFDESGASPPAPEVMRKDPAGDAALLVGPEGGFSPRELEILKQKPYARGCALGPRVLKAETAAVAGLTCWQCFCGDWDARPAFEAEGQAHENVS